MSTVIKRLVDLYTQEGIKVSYTFEDFHRDMAKEYVHLLPPEERLLGLKPEERLAGLSEEQIRAYLERLQHSKDCNIN